MQRPNDGCARGSGGRPRTSGGVPPPPPRPRPPSRRPPLRNIVWAPSAAAAAAGHVRTCRRSHCACAAVTAAAVALQPMGARASVADAGQVRASARSRCGRRGPGGGVPPPPQPRLRSPSRRPPLRSNCRTLEVGASAAQLVSCGGRPFRLRQPLPCPRRAARRGHPTRESPRQKRRPRNWCARARGRLACGHRCRARRLCSRRGLAWHSCARGGGCGGGIGGRGRAVGSPPLLCSQKGA